jgi:hypothetical protein
VVAKAIWKLIGEVIRYDIGSDYLSVASKWLHKNKCYGGNIIVATVVMRGVWLSRNGIMFNDQTWSDVRSILKTMMRLILEWKPIFKEEEMEEMKTWLYYLEKLTQEPSRIQSV